MTCTKCGASMLPGAGFCGVCGHRMDGQAATPQSQQPSANYGNAQGIHIDQDSRGQGRGYSYEVLHQPSFSLAVVNLQADNPYRRKPAPWFRCRPTLSCSRR
jgi:hypothetical protein